MELLRFGGSCRFALLLHDRLGVGNNFASRLIGGGLLGEPFASVKVTSANEGGSDREEEEALHGGGVLDVAQAYGLGFMTREIRYT